MNSADVIGYVLDGCVICPDCVDAATREDEETGAVFADNGPELSGSTCDTCGAVWVDSCLEWVSRDDVTNRDYYRWATCSRCNNQEPFYKLNSDVRLDARLGLLRCHSCGGLMRF